MGKLLTILVVTAMLSASQVHAGALAPAPQIIAEYDRSFIERSGAQTFGEMLDTGIIRYFFTGGRNLLILVNGRPYATTASNLDSLPLSAIERIEVLRAESLGTFGGHAAVRGAFNLVLRKDLDGFDVRAVTRLPSRDGGEAQQGSAVWGGTIGNGGHLTVGVDILNRNEIGGSTRDHSRSEWTPGGSFSDAQNVSTGGNTVYVLDDSESELRAIPLGGCDQAHGYTGPLTNPSGAKLGDKGCGYPYGDVWWDSPSKEQENAILNLNHPLGEQAELHVDANVTQGRDAFRYAPSVGTFSITPEAGSALLNAINQSAGNADTPFTPDENNDVFAVAHRFIGHGNRDWRTSTEEYDVSASVKGRFTESVSYDARISASQLDGSVSGDTFVDHDVITEEINEGRYDLTNPLSDDSIHQTAIDRSSLREELDFGSKYLGSRFALEGIGWRDAAWTAGVEFADVESRYLLAFRSIENPETTVTVDKVLGSGGTSYSGERNTAGVFAEMSLPLVDSVDVRAAARADDYDDVGGLRAWRLGAEYHLSDMVTLRGSWSSGDNAPSMYHLHSTVLQDYPYVRCVPASGPPPRTCTENFVQVKRLTSGNPELDPSGSERRSVGFETRKGPFYFIADWYQLATSDLPGQHNATWAMLNYDECVSNNTTSCIQRVAGEITIHDNFDNIVKTEISGINTRFGTLTETDWGFVAMRGFWRYVASSEERILGEKQRYPLPRNAVRIVTSARRGDLTVFWALNYRDEIENRDGGQFGSWTGHDVTLDWRKPLGLENTRVTAGVYNVTDAKLSTNTASASLTDGPRAAGWGRTFFVTLNMRF